MELTKFTEECVGKKFIKSPNCNWSVKGKMLCIAVNYATRKDLPIIIYSAQFRDELGSRWHLTPDEVILIDSVGLTAQDIFNQTHF